MLKKSFQKTLLKIYKLIKKIFLGYFVTLFIILFFFHRII